MASKKALGLVSTLYIYYFYFANSVTISKREVSETRICHHSNGVCHHGNRACLCGNSLL